MQVVSFAGARARRDNVRLQELQAAFQLHGYQLHPLTEDTWTLWCPLGCRQQLPSLDEAQRLLVQLGSTQ